MAPGRFMRFGKKGSSDIIGVLPGGRFLAVECKSQYGRLSPEQEQFHADIEKLGGFAIVAHNWRELDEALHKAGYGMVDMPLFTVNNTSPYGGE